VVLLVRHDFPPRGSLILAGRPEKDTKKSPHGNASETFQRHAEGDNRKRWNLGEEQAMAAEEARRVQSSAELSVGDEIEAWHNGKLFHRGRVNQTVASMDLFWIVDSRTGARRLIDVEALVILRASGPAETPPYGTATAGSAPAGSAAASAGTAVMGSGSAQAGSGARARPTSHVPLFQAPSLAL
jgi:hypothetical protein